MKTDLVPLYRFWQPRYWPMWLGIGLMRLIVLCPHNVRMAIGRSLGRLIQRVARSRNHIATRNIEICFPELSTAEQQDLVRRHFESIGMGVIELGISLWGSEEFMQSIVEFKGLNNVEDALQAGKGILLFSGHFATTEFAGRRIRPEMPSMSAMYRPSKNPLTDQIMRRCRLRSLNALITKTSIRQLLKELKHNHVVWYAADQAYTGKGMVMAPFFNELATTNTAISQICKLSKAPLIPFHTYRMDNGKGYRVEMLPALDNFPSGDDMADAIRLNKLLEDFARKSPEQYYWVHRRFKGRPAEFSDPYE